MPLVEQLPRGLDCSAWQSAVNWPAVAASGIAFAWAKATEGIGYLDPFFSRNWTQIRQNGMVRGAYHFAQPDHNAPEAEAEWFVGHVMGQGLLTGDLLALDLEAGSGDLAEWTLRFLRHTEMLVGYKPMVYSSPGFIDAHNLARLPEIGEYGLWCASWGGKMPDPPAPWPFVACWQYTDKETVPGVAGPCDGDRFNLEVSRIPLYGKPAVEEPPPDPEPTTTLADVKAALTEAVAAFDRGDALRDAIRAIADGIEV